MLTTDWQKSSFSSGNTDNCVEARIGAAGVEVRHSKNPDGPAISFTPAEWAAFVAGAKMGEFDLP